MKKVPIVINEHTLGFTHNGRTYDVLHASILKGAIFDILPEPKMIFPCDVIRLATEQDFKNFRHSSEGYF